MRGDLLSGEPHHRTAHRAKRASSERSGFFRPEGFEAGAGASTGGEGRLGTISAALALSSRNLSNSATQNQGQGQAHTEAQTAASDLLPTQSHSLVPTRSPQHETPPLPHWPGTPAKGGAVRGRVAASQRQRCFWVRCCLWT